MFEETMNRINNIFADAEKAGFGTYMLGCIACLSAYLVYLCFDTHYDQVKYLNVSILSCHQFS